MIKNRIIKILAVLVIAWAAFWLIFNAITFSLTSDETVYAPAGYRYITNGDVIINNEHPPLNKLLSGLFVAPFNPEINKAIKETPDNNQWQLGDKFWYESGNNTELLLFMARVPTVILTMAMLVSVFLFLSGVYSPVVGLGAIGILAASPNILAHGALSTNDLHLVAFAWFLFVASYNLIKKYSKKNLVWWGLAIGFMALSKFSGPFFIVISIFAVIIAYWKRGAWRLVKILIIGAAISLFCIWSSYVFIERNTLSKLEPVSVRVPVVGNVQLDSQIGKFSMAPIFRYWEGYTAVTGHNAMGHSSYLNGKVSLTGFRSYFSWAIWYKTPLPILLLALIGVGIAVVRKKVVVLIVTGSTLAYFVFASFGHIHIGVRHVLPIYLGISLSGALAISEFIKTRWGGALLIIFALFLAVDLSMNSPNKISYFSMVSGGNKKGYEHIADSNLDWGQETDIVYKYIKDNRPNNLILAQATGENLKYRGIKFEHIRDFQCGSFPDNSTVIMSANFAVGLLGPYPCAITSIEAGEAARVGDSYFVFKGKDLND